ncbi:hypothetical protein B9Z55_007736 [Caenorhabditis nigoni]|nr:hypothetical protein B9Z55_007736 [Caenorhabditis nigoni]
MNEIHEKLAFLVVKTEKIENLNEQKFDEFAEKLQSIEASVSEVAILSNNQHKKKLNSEKKFVLNHVFNKVIEFEEDVAHFSKKECHFKANWYMSVKRQNNHLGFYVRCDHVVPKDKWSIQTQLIFKTVGRNQNVIKTSEYCYEENCGYGFHQFLRWEEMKNQYLIDDNLTVEVEVNILKMTGFEKENLRNFDESVKECSDVVLVVNDRKFYLSKFFLGLQSSYFKSLLLGKFEESQKKEIELKDIDPDDFQNFLELIHGESSIDDDTVSGILHLADMYDAPTAIRRCEEFLLEKSKKNLKNKLQLANRYRLEKLKEKCMNEIKTIEDLRSVIPNSINDLDHQTTLDLLSKSISFR